MCRSIKLGLILFCLAVASLSQEVNAAPPNTDAAANQTGTPEAAAASHTTQATNTNATAEQPAAPPSPETPEPVKQAEPTPAEPVNQTADASASEIAAKTEPQPEAPATPHQAAAIADSPVIQVQQQIPIVVHSYKPSEGDTANPQQSPEVEEGYVENEEGSSSYIEPPNMSPEELEKFKHVEQSENLARDSVNLDFSHVRSYSFHVTTTEDFVIKVSTDHEVKGIINVYWEQDRTYIMSSYKPGEEVRLFIYGNEHMVLSREFYQSTGFRFDAKKGVQYMLRFDKSGLDKLILLHFNNFVSEDKVEDALHQSTFKAFNDRSNQLLGKLQTIMQMSESNALINDQISENVLKHTHAYLTYQFLEILFVAVATISQFYMIRRLVLGSTSVV